MLVEWISLYNKDRTQNKVTKKHTANPKLQLSITDPNLKLPSGLMAIQKKKNSSDPM